MLSLLLALNAQAAEVQVTSTSLAPFVVLVDGLPVEPGSNGMAVARNLPAGRHVVETRNLAGKTTAYKEFDLRADEQIRFEYRKRELWHIGTYAMATGQPVAQVPATVTTTTTTETVSLGAPGVGLTVSDGTETVSVNAGLLGAGVVVSDGQNTVNLNAGVTVTESVTSTTTVTTGGPAVAVPPAANPYVMDPGSFSRFLGALGNATFADDKHALLRTTAANNGFTCDQLGRILDVYTHGSDKVEAVRIARPSVVDPQNAYLLQDKFTFGSDAQEALALFR